MIDFMSSIYKRKKSGPKTEPVAHHKLLHEADLILYCLTRSVAAGHSDMTQTNQKFGFENHKTTVFLIKSYGRQY